MISNYNHSMYFHIKFAEKYSYWKVLENNGKTRTTSYYRSITRNDLLAFAGAETRHNSGLFLVSNDENFQFSSVNKEYI